MEQIGGNFASFGDRIVRGKDGEFSRAKGGCGRSQTLRVVASVWLPRTNSLPASFECVSDGHQDQADRNDRP
jgi:hypothetical protein